MWREGHLTLRVAYALCGMTPGKELDEYKSLLQLLPMGFGDDMLRFNGLGERITWAMNNNDHAHGRGSGKVFPRSSNGRPSAACPSPCTGITTRPRSDAHDF